MYSKMNWLIAKHIFNLEVHKDSYLVISGRFNNRDGEVCTIDDLPDPYAQKIEYAWRVFETLHGYTPSLTYFPDELKYECKIHLPPRERYAIIGRGSTAAIAICKAALLLHGISDDEYTFIFEEF